MYTSRQNFQEFHCPPLHAKASPSPLSWALRKESACVHWLRVKIQQDQSVWRRKDTVYDLVKLSQRSSVQHSCSRLSSGKSNRRKPAAFGLLCLFMGCPCSDVRPLFAEVARAPLSGCLLCCLQSSRMVCIGGCMFERRVESVTAA